MGRGWEWLGVPALFIIAISFSFIQARLAAYERPLRLDQLPRAARTAVEQRVPQSASLELTMEDDAVYEAEFEVDGRSRSVEVNAVGQVLEEEMEVELDEVPAAVMEAFAREFPGFTATEVERGTMGPVVMYELEWLENGEQREAEFTADGLLVQHEVEDEAHDHKHGESASGEVHDHGDTP